MGENDLDGIVEGQPLRLKLQRPRRLLEAAGDTDREFFREAEEGLPGHATRYRGRHMSLKSSYVGLLTINPGSRG